MSNEDQAVACPHLQAEVAPHFNEAMLLNDRVARCIGYAEDEDDCYIIARYVGGEEIWHTMVGGYVWLDRLGERDRRSLDNLLALNGSPREQEFTTRADSAPSP